MLGGVHRQVRKAWWTRSQALQRRQTGAANKRVSEWASEEGRSTLLWIQRGTNARPVTGICGKTAHASVAALSCSSGKTACDDSQ